MLTIDVFAVNAFRFVKCDPGNKVKDHEYLVRDSINKVQNSVHSARRYSEYKISDSIRKVKEDEYKVRDSTRVKDDE